MDSYNKRSFSDAFPNNPEQRRLSMDSPHAGHHHSMDSPHAGHHHSMDSPHAGHHHSMDSPHAGHHHSLHTWLHRYGNWHSASCITTCRFCPLIIWTNPAITTHQWSKSHSPKIVNLIIFHSLETIGLFWVNMTHFLESAWPRKSSFSGLCWRAIRWRPAEKKGLIYTQGERENYWVWFSWR